MPTPSFLGTAAVGRYGSNVIWVFLIIQGGPSVAV